MELIITTPEKLKALIKEAIKETDEGKKKNEIPKLYSINQVAKRLGKAHATIQKLVKNDYLKTTKSGLITETSLNEYLQIQ